MKKQLKTFIKYIKQFFVQVFAHMLAVILIAEMSIFALPAIAADSIVVDPNASGNKPTVDSAPNGVTIVNLATTNSNGVSHNKFTDYNVSPSGVILNNSTIAGVSQLGGAIYGNPNYQGGQAASLVINEVTGSKRSNLNGYTEMFGQRADFILANPNGIVCNGAGFINIPRVTLGTGIPIFSNGIFQGLDIRGGDISIEGTGLDASQTDYFTIVTRMTSLSGPLWGKDVSIITGTGLYNYNNAVFTQIDAESGKPEFAIDASALGSIYAGRISLVCNEKGVGVRSQSDLLADTSDIRISADGNIELNNVQAAKNVEVASASGEIVQTGAAIAVEDLDYSAEKTTNRGSITGLDTVNITGELDNEAGSIASEGNININTNGELNNRNGQIIQAGNESGSININSADSINGTGGVIKSSGALTLDMAGDIILSGSEGALYAARQFTLNADNVVNNIALEMDGDININAAGNIQTNSGSKIVSNNSVNLKSDAEISNSGTISGDSIEINAASLENSGEITGGASSTEINTTGDVNNSNRISSASDLTINAANVINEQNAGTPETFPEISSGNDLTITANTVTNKAGLIFSAGDMALEVASLYNESTNVTESTCNTAYIYSQGKLDIGNEDSDNTVYNYSGRIESEKDMNINLGENGKLENTGADVGTYTSETVHLGGYGSEYYALMDQTYLYTGTMQTISGNITSQSNMNITTGELKNHGSVISAANDLDITANYVINETYSIPVYLTYYQHWGKKHHWEKRIGGKWGWKWKEGNDYYDYWSPGTITVASGTNALIQAGGNLRINSDHIFNGLSSEYDATRKDEIENTHNTASNTGRQGNTSSSSFEDLLNTGTIDISDYITIGENGDAMFKLDKNPGSRYLIETRSQYVDLSSLYGSDYFFSRIDYNPDTQIKLLGDALYEQKIIMQAILQETTEKYLSENISSDQEEMKYLLDNAATAYRDLQLSVGVELTKEQINALQEPIIWYVETKVRGIAVLCPKIYIPEHIIAGFTKNDTPKIVGSTVNMNITNGLTNSGLIQGNSSVKINAGSITNITTGNSQAQITGNDVNLTAEGDIVNTGGAIKAENSLSLNVGGDIINEAIEKMSIFSWTEQSRYGINKIKVKERREVVSSFGSAASIESSGTLTVNASGDFINKSSRVKADGNAVINVGGDIINETLVSISTRSNGEVLSTLGETASIDSGNTLVINAGGDFTNIAANVKSGGDAEINVEGSISFETAKLYNVIHESKYGVSGTTNSTTSAGSSLEVGGNLKMASDGDIYFIGSTADVAGNADVKTAGNFNMINDYDEESFYGQKTEKKSFGRKKTTTVSTYDTTIVASVFKTGGDFNVNAGNDVNVIGSSITSEGDTSVNAEGNYNIIAVNEEHLYKKTTKKSGFGTGGSLYGSVKTTDMTYDSKVNSSNLDIKGKYASHSGKDTNIVGSNITANEAEITTGGNLNIMAAYDQHDEQHTTETSGMGGGKNMYSMSLDSVSEGYTKAVGSIINAGTLTVKSGNDVYIEGSTINANDASFDVAGNFTETTARETSYHHEIHESANITAGSGLKSIAMSALTAGYTSRNMIQYENGRFFVEAGKAEYHKLDEKTDKTTQASSVLNIGNSLSIKAGNDITIAGSDVNVGGDASLNAGGNINILTAEETERMRSEEIEGKAVVTVGAKNAWVDVAYAGKALLEAKEQLKNAKNDYEHYKDQLSKAKDDYKKGLIDKEDLESIQDQEKYYKANLALLSENVLAKTLSLTMTTISAAANSSHGGFTGDVQLDVTGRITKETSFSTSQKSSNIMIGGNLSLEAGETAKIQGSNVVANGDILIDAQNVEILSAQETMMSTKDEKNAHINVTINMGGGGSVNADFGMSGDRSDSTTHVNSYLAGNNITIRSAKDTTVSGGIVQAENTLDLNVGGNLLVESVQDKSSSGSFSFGISGGGSANSGNGGVNFSFSESKRKWVSEQTSLTGGNVNIYVENKTTLKGAVIASTINDPANLKIDTGSFEYVNIKDKDTMFTIGGGSSFGLSFKENNDQTGGSFKPSYSANASYGYTDKRQNNFATIGEGTIIVRDGDSDLSGLHRDVSTAQYGTFDVGTKGVTGVDSKIVNAFVYYDDTINDVKKGYDNLKEAVVTTIKTYERSKNFILTDYGFKTDDGVRIQKSIDAGNATKYGSLDYFNDKVELFYYGEGQDNIHLVRDGQGNVTAIIERSADGLDYGVYKYGNDGGTYSSLDVNLNNPNFSLTKEGYLDNTYYVFDKINAVTEFAGITKNDELFTYTVNGAKSYFSNLQFENQEQLNYIFAGIMDNLGGEFDMRTGNGISYGFQKFAIQDGEIGAMVNNKFTNISKVDCASLVTLGVNIMGLTNPDEPNINFYDKSKYSYNGDIDYAVRKNVYEERVIQIENNAPANQAVLVDQYINGVTNLVYNDQFKYVKNNGQNDLTGLIGVTAVSPTDYNSSQYAYTKDLSEYRRYDQEGMLNHVFVSTDADSTRTVESTSFFTDNNSKNQYNGIRRDIPSAYNNKHLDFYLQLQLPNARIVNNENK